jgi:hypothetical protein
MSRADDRLVTSLLKMTGVQQLLQIDHHGWTKSKWGTWGLDDEKGGGERVVRVPEIGYLLNTPSE